MKSYRLFIFLATALVACVSAKKLTPSTIGVLPIHNYILKQQVTFSDTVTYRIFTRAEEFHNIFTMTKTTPGAAIVPDFNAQWVVAIILQPSERVITIDINKAEITGNDLNIYYNVTDTTSWKTFAHTPKAVAILPKSVDVKQVHFFSRNGRNKTLNIN